MLIFVQINKGIVSHSYTVCMEIKLGPSNQSIIKCKTLNYTVKVQVELQMLIAWNFLPKSVSCRKDEKNKFKGEKIMHRGRKETIWIVVVPNFLTLKIPLFVFFPARRDTPVGSVRNHKKCSFSFEYSWFWEHGLFTDYSKSTKNITTKKYIFS